MFPQKFTNDARMTITNHCAIQFPTNLSKPKLVALVKKMGIAAFFEPDTKATYAIQFKDGRIVGAPTYQRNAGCCSFTKDANLWYFFPIHRAELENVGIGEQDLIRWIKYLNDLKVGFKYLYFGAQEGSKYMDDYWRSATGSNRERYTDNNYYWIAVPKSAPASSNSKIPYLHWIYLRYLINGTTSSNVTSGAYRHAYYNIPRIIFYLQDVLGLKPFKAFMYAIACGAWYNGYGLAHSDFTLTTQSTAVQIPYLKISAKTFADLWKNSSAGYMNQMLTSSNPYKKQPLSLHDPEKCWQLYNKGDIKAIVEHLDDVYYPKKKSTKPTREGLKKIRSVSKKAKAAANS